MSKRNREKRGWKCSKCGMKMYRNLAEPARSQAKKMLPKGHIFQVVHFCGECKTPHYQEGDKLRGLSKGELFKLHLEIPKTLKQIENTTYAPQRGEVGSLMIAKD